MLIGVVLHAEDFIPSLSPHMYAHTHTHTQTHTHTHTQTHAHANTDTHTYTHIHKYMHTQTHRYTNTHTHKHPQTHRHTNTYTHTQKHTYTHTHKAVGISGTGNNAISGTAAISAHLSLEQQEGNKKNKHTQFSKPKTLHMSSYDIGLRT